MSILPVMPKSAPTQQEETLSVFYYPIVGIILGVILYGFQSLLSGYTTPFFMAALLAALWAVITGGLHLDGVADCADGLIGGMASPERRLEIMKDPHVGAMAVMTLTLLVALKVAALQQLIDGGNFTGFQVILIPFLARANAVWMIVWLPYVSAQGLLSRIIKGMPKFSLGVLGTISFFIGLIVLGWDTMLALLVVLLIFLYFSKRLLGGANGDVYGAVIEVSEVVLLSTIAIGHGVN